MGSEGRSESPGRGAAIVGRLAAADHPTVDSNNHTVIVQGYGQVGSSAARKFHEDGARVVAVSDISGGIYNANGLDIPALDSFLRSGGTMADFEGADQVPNSELLETRRRGAGASGD